MKPFEIFQLNITMRIPFYLIVFLILFLHLTSANSSDPSFNIIFNQTITPFGESISTIQGSEDEHNYTLIYDINGQLIARVDENGAVYYFHYDQVGNIVAVTGDSGNVTNPFQFAGKEYDNETGLYYFGARYYDPETGRFITTDPVEGSDSPYSYAENNPLTNVE